MESIAVFVEVVGSSWKCHLTSREFLVELNGKHVHQSCRSLHGLALTHESATLGGLLAGRTLGLPIKASQGTKDSFHGMSK
jgi:hypothetical protein